MIIGMLECDHVADHLKDEYGDYSDMFQRLWPDIIFQSYDVYRGHFPKSAEECDVYFVTGSKHSVYDDIPWIHQLKSFVRDINTHQKFYIGICFGHQMLAEALGGKVEKNAQGWCVGIHPFQLKSKEDWMDPYFDEINLLMSCQDQVLRMPENSTLLASSKDCLVGIFKVGEKMLGIQGHPEFPKAYDRALIESRSKSIGPVKLKDSLKSLEGHHDGALFADWVMQFLQLCSQHLDY